jgi:hypothetical protein
MTNSRCIISHHSTISRLQSSQGRHLFLFLLRTITRIMLLKSTNSHRLPNSLSSMVPSSLHFNIRVHHKTFLRTMFMPLSRCTQVVHRNSSGKVHHPRVNHPSKVEVVAVEVVPVVASQTIVVDLIKLHSWALPFVWDLTITVAQSPCLKRAMAMRHLTTSRVHLILSISQPNRLTLKMGIREDQRWTQIPSMVKAHSAVEGASFTEEDVMVLLETDSVEVEERAVGDFRSTEMVPLDPKLLKHHRSLLKKLLSQQKARRRRRRSARLTLWA